MLPLSSGVRLSRQMALTPEVRDTMRDLNAIDWSNVRTAYGFAQAIPELLTQLAGKDQSVAMAAAHQLWCSLCHQHAYVSSAALPALPFLLIVLDTADDALAAEIMDILLGFVVCDTDGETHAPWIDELHVAVAKERPRFVSMLSAQDECIASIAASLLEVLDHSPAFQRAKA